MPGRRHGAENSRDATRQRNSSETCSWCRVEASSSTPLTLDKKDGKLYCSKCWQSYYGRPPPKHSGYDAKLVGDRTGGGASAPPQPQAPAVVDQDVHAARHHAVQEESDDEGFWELPVSKADVPATSNEDVSATEQVPSLGVEEAVESNVVDAVAPHGVVSHALAAAARFAKEVATLAAQGVDSADEEEIAVASDQQTEELETLAAIYGDALELGPSDQSGHASGSQPRRPRTFRLELASEVSDAGPVEIWVNTSDGKVLAGTVETLPPVVLQCALPSRYPSAQRPIAVLCAEHVSAADVAALEAELVQQAEERPGEPVLFDWASLLQERAASIPSSLLFDDAGGNDAMDTALRLLANDRRAKDERRNRELQQCPVCFDDVLGSRGVFLECGHFGCRECLGQMARLHTGEADIGALRCPVTNCREQFGIEALRDLLGADSPELKRWEELCLQQCLDKMQDVAYCPRCDLEGSGNRVPCIQDEDGLAQCDACGFAFCGRCRDAYHPGQPCASRDDRMDALEARAAGQGPEALAARAELATLRALSKTTKACPTCSTAIEKIEGCSKMQCRVCKNHFCWRCGKTIEGYDHYATGACKLFDDDEIRRWNQRAQQVLRAEARAHEARFLAQFIDPEAMWEQLRGCPQCRAAVLKQGRNNHLKCHVCQANFCGKCGLLLPKQRPHEHFQKKAGAPGCPQHSDD